MYFPTAAPKMRVVIEGFPKVVDGLVPRLGPCINEDTDLRLNNHG
jgi:hypothetical protein